MSTVTSPKRKCSRVFKVSVHTRKRAISISEDINEDIDLKNTMYEKRRLPIKRVSLKCSVSEKIIKTSKKFIISVVVILDKNFRNLKLWVRG